MNGALLLGRSDVERLLTPDACIAAVEDVFRQHALGKVPALQLFQALKTDPLVALAQFRIEASTGL